MKNHGIVVLIFLYFCCTNVHVHSFLHAELSKNTINPDVEEAETISAISFQEKVRSISSLLKPNLLNSMSSPNCLKVSQPIYSAPSLRTLEFDTDIMSVVSYPALQKQEILRHRNQTHRKIRFHAC